MPGRKYSQANGNYRYGFNGKENDNEVWGEGNQQDYGMRIYDTRIGKFLSVDPLMKTYPWYTPYQFAGNKPIWATDLDGLEENTTSTYVKKPIPLLNKLDKKQTKEQPFKQSMKAVSIFLVGVASDKYAPSALVFAAKQYYPEIETFNPTTSSYAQNSNLAVGVLLYSFATGSGIRDNVFDENSSVAYDFFYGGRNVAAEIQTKLYEKINEQKLSSSELNGKTFKIPIGFSPDQVPLGESVEKHLNSNAIQFFVGGANATITFDGTNAKVSVYNETSRSSLFLHGKLVFASAAVNEERSSPTSSGAPLSTISETFKNAFSVDKSKIKKPDPVKSKE